MEDPFRANAGESAPTDGMGQQEGYGIVKDELSVEWQVWGRKNNPNVERVSLRQYQTLFYE